MKIVLAAALIALSTLSHAETSAAKKQLVDKVLQLQRPAIENQGRMMAEQPALQLMQRVGPVIQQRVPPEKREALAKDVQADLRKYSDEAVPIVRDRAVKLMPSTMGALLEAQFSEAELKQLINAMEAPAVRKFQQANGEMMKSLSDKLVAELRPELEPKIKALELSVTKRFEAVLGPVPTAPGPAPGPAPKP